MNRFPVFESVQVTDYRLYPGADKKSGLYFEFNEGISLLVGINGLGKTTLITMLFRLLVGGYDLKKDEGNSKFGAAARDDVVRWPATTKFFTQRVADKAQRAFAELKFRVGDTKFRVKRSLNNLRLVECDVGGQAISIDSSETLYRDALCAAAGASVFVDFVTAVKYLTFFDEDRRDVLWDAQAQRQFFRILFSDPSEAKEWIELEQEISRHDSRARNHSYSAKQYEDELREQEKLLHTNAGTAAALAAEQAYLDADLETLEKLQDRAKEIEEELAIARREHERAKLVESDARRAVEEMRFSALEKLFPDLSETAQYLLTQLYAGGRCLACEQTSPGAAEVLEVAIAKHVCAICGQPNSLSATSTVKAAGVDFEDARQALQNAIVHTNALADDHRRLDDEWRAISTDIAATITKVNELKRKSEALRAQLPPAPEDIEQLRKSAENLRKSQIEEEKKRLGAEAKYRSLIERVNGRIQANTASVSRIFQDLIARFLEEECTLTYATVKSRPSVNGAWFDYPALKFEMTAAAFEGQQIRDTPDDVSESQREFIDLAFRMSLMEASSADDAMSLVIETPEASLDDIFMSRAADLFAAFARPPRSVIVTSNLTNSTMIPAMMGPPTADPAVIAKRELRVLNLLEVAAPNAAVERHKAHYTAVLEKGIRGERA